MGMSSAEFEIHVNRGGRWQIEGAESNEANAIAVAKRRVSMPGVEGVRVVREATSRLGRVSQTVVFEQAGQAADSGVITVRALETPPARCDKAADLYRARSPLAMSTPVPH